MAYLGIDTSNYTTSVALYDKGKIYQQRKLLPVQAGTLGLRQSDAVFSHVKALGELSRQLMADKPDDICSFGVSAYPRNQEGSYMPCFLVGCMAAEFAASVKGVTLHKFSHQAGHIAAALLGSNRLDLIPKKFIALHISGGTTECLLVNDLIGGDISIISATCDLNAGQIVDRVGNMLGKSFPSGKEVDKLANLSKKQFKIKTTFKGFNPCLSGVENQVKKMLSQGCLPEDAARYTIDYILAVVKKMAQDAISSTGCNEVIFAGGVMSNSIIKSVLSTKKDYIFSPPEFSTDNAVGIAVLTAYKEGKL